MQIPVFKPHLGAAEISLVNEALKSNAISCVFGEFIPRFEAEFAAFCGTKYAISCSNGTVALHLAMVAAGIQAGDEVLVSTTTNMATFFAVLYIGAKPIPVDIDLMTYNLDPADLERKITPKTKAIMVVHLFGHPADMDSINAFADKRGLLVFEDCAEAHGALYKRRPVGGLGTAGAFSFFANKVITTGEGGMVTTNDPAIAERAKNLRSLAFGYDNKFMHREVGFNYRMTNIQAAIGCGQMLSVEKLVNSRRDIADFYNSKFCEYQDYINCPTEKEWAKNVIWMYHLGLKGPLADKRTQIMKDLKELGVETREGFIPFNMQEIFINQGIVSLDSCPNANSVAYSTFYLPTSPSMTKEELDYVASKFCSVLDKYIARN